MLDPASDVFLNGIFVLTFPPIFLLCPIMFGDLFSIGTPLGVGGSPPELKRFTGLDNSAKGLAAFPDISLGDLR